MYHLKTPDGATVEIEDTELRRRVASGEVRPWDRVSSDGELFIQIRGLVEFRGDFDGVAVAVDETCYRHADQLSQMRCPQCARGYCGRCVPRETIGTSSALACPACGALLEKAFSKAREKPFWREPGRVLLFPLTKFGFVTTIALGLMFWAGLMVPPITLVFYLMALAWVAHVVAISAEGKKDMGFGPDLDDIWHLMGRGLMVFLVSVAVALPLVAWNLVVLRQLWVSGLRAVPLLLGNLPLLLVAFCYYPMALGMASVWNNKWVAFQPNVVVSHALLIKEDYAAVLIAWAILLVTGSVAGLLLRIVPIFGGMLASIVSAYLLLVKAHILGFTLYLNSSRLDWD